MYVIDITRFADENKNDIMLAKNSIDAKLKMMDYISDYVLANYGFTIDNELLDDYMTFKRFSLNHFLGTFYNCDLKDNLLMYSYFIDKEHCLFLKIHDDINPILIPFKKNELKKASNYLTFYTNDKLICDFKNFKEYKQFKKYYNDNKLYYNRFINELNLNDMNAIINLYKEDDLIDTLLNNNISYNKIGKNKDYLI